MMASLLTTSFGSGLNRTTATLLSTRSSTLLLSRYLQQETVKSIEQMLPQLYRDTHALSRSDYKHQLPAQLKPRSLFSDLEPVKLSYVKGSNSPPLIEKTIGHFFEDQVERFGTKEVLRSVHQNVRWSWGDLKKNIDMFALGLLQLGFRKGDRIGIMLPTAAEWVVTEFATSKTGIIMVNINPAYRTNELEHALKLVGCKGLILTPQFKTTNYAEMIKKIIPDYESFEGRPIQSSKLPDLQYLIHDTDQHLPGMIRFNDLLVKEPSIELSEYYKQLFDSLSQYEPINIQFTSGTTGLPKGATLTHRNILNNGYTAGLMMKLTPNDTLCIPVPLYHCFGLVLGNLAAITAGAKIVYPAAGFDPLKTLQAIQSEKCTAIHGVPTMFISEMDHAEFQKFDLSSIRTGIMAGAPCPVEVMKKVMRKMHCTDILICYGMTETSPGSFISNVDDDVNLRCETVGRVAPHVEARIVDPTTNHIVPTNTVGELHTKGYLVMQGYWNAPESTKAAVDPEGWMKTGDLATIDDDGYCRIVGRIKDMVIRGGENVYPREIEEFLHTHPGIAEVQVFGVPDQKFGEQVAAWVKLREGASLDEKGLRKFCEGTIAHFKIPHYIFFVKGFPMTVTGKAQKNEMREVTSIALGIKSGSKTMTEYL